MKRYLLEDYTGAASKTEYGKKGDEVRMIKEEGGMALVENKGELFHIRIEKLTEHKLVADPTPIIHEPLKPPEPRKRSTTRKPAKPQTLF